MKEIPQEGHVSPSASRTSRLNLGRRSTAKKREAPRQLYLRTIHDLTLHGGVSAGGVLILLPIISGLGTRGIKPKDYLEQSAARWQDGSLARCLRDINWAPGRPVIYRARYPALSSVLPLPAPAVIDHILATSDECSDRSIAEEQLKRCAVSSRWRMFRCLGESIGDDREALDLLLAGEASYPGLLTDNFRLVLEALQALHTTIDQAENEGKFFIASSAEVHFAMTLALRRRFSEKVQGEPQNWRTYFKSLQDMTAELQGITGDAAARFSPACFTALVKQLGEKELRWTVMADIGAVAVISCAQAIERAQAREGIWPEDIPLDSVISPSYWTRESANKLAQARSLRFQEALAFVWRTLVLRAMKAKFYHKVELPLPLLAKAWSQRQSSDSAMISLWEQTPSRPIAEGASLVVRMEASAKEARALVRVEPGVLKPAAAALLPSSRAKKCSGISERFTLLSELWLSHQEGVNGAVPSFYSDETGSFFWPSGRLWQAVDLVKSCLAYPQLLLCPEFFARGHLRLPAEVWEKKEASLSSVTDSDVNLSWAAVHDWFLGTLPWIKQPLPPKTPRYFYESTSVSWPVAVFDGGMALSEVRLGVKFVPVGDAAENNDCVSLLNIIKKLGTSSADQEQRSSELEGFLADLGKSLRFIARPYFTVEGQEVEEEVWFSALKAKAGYFVLSNGLMVDARTYNAKTDQFILRKRVYAKFTNMRLSEIWSVQQTALTSAGKTLGADEYIRQLGLQVSPILRELDNRALAPLAQQFLSGKFADLSGVLRPYQSEGSAWAYLRFHLGFGVCIADEMGLGKTLQAIALLRKVHNSPSPPSLVVMPKAILYNWSRELERYGKGLRVGLYGEEDFDAPVEVWLVSYPRLRLDQAVLTLKKWNLVVLDEAQAIKNAETQTAEAASQLEARYRLILTGTPVENRAAELWSLVNWLNPGFLGDQGDFSAYTTLARSSEQKAALLAPLRECLDPLILRRLKSDPKIALGLPDKILLDVGCELSEEQLMLYETVLETVLAEESLVGKRAFARRAMFLKAILYLKRICIHPDLFYGEHDEGELVSAITHKHDEESSNTVAQGIKQRIVKRLKKNARASSSFDAWVKRSGKLLALQELLDSLRGQSKGILIFTQYLGAAAILRRTIGHQQQAGELPFIHGGLSARERLEIVDEFNEDCRLHQLGEACPILILSIKAGGTGLNLTGADRVIHFDRWWNPAVEDQATDRAHRLGQTRKVFCHTITSQGTIEESIGRIFVNKRRLAEDLLGAVASEEVGEHLQHRDGFLDLVDPQHLFSRRLLTNNSVERKS